MRGEGGLHWEKAEPAPDSLPPSTAVSLHPLPAWCPRSTWQSASQLPPCCVSSPGTPLTIRVNIRRPRERGQDRARLWCQGSLRGVVLLLGDAWFGGTLCSSHPRDAGAPPGRLSKAVFPLLCPYRTAPTSPLDPIPGAQIILRGTLTFLSLLEVEVWGAVERSAALCLSRPVI